MNGVRLAQRERCDLDVKPVALRCDHLIGSVHRAERRLERTARGVFERFPRVERRLLPDDAKSSNLLDAVFSVGDGPVPTDQLYCVRALVGDLNRV